MGYLLLPARAALVHWGYSGSENLGRGILVSLHSNMAVASFVSCCFRLRLVKQAVQGITVTAAGHYTTAANSCIKSAFFVV